jgi:hypothetical protein
MKTKQLILRQGDVLLIQVAALPANVNPVECKDRCVLAYGEVTGHAHVIEARHVKAFSDRPTFDAGAERFIQALEKTALRHEEHSPIEIPPGIYRVAVQTEYTPQELRRVAD